MREVAAIEFFHANTGRSVTPTYPYNSLRKNSGNAKAAL
jgi:hypothetical protein